MRVPFWKCDENPKYGYERRIFNFWLATTIFILLITIIFDQPKIKHAKGYIVLNFNTTYLVWVETCWCRVTYFICFCAIKKPKKLLIFPSRLIIRSFYSGKITNDFPTIAICYDNETKNIIVENTHNRFHDNRSNDHYETYDAVLFFFQFHCAHSPFLSLLFDCGLESVDCERFKENKYDL